MTEVRMMANRIISRLYRYRAADLFLNVLKDEEARQEFLFGLIEIPAYQRAPKETKEAVLQRVLSGLSFAGARKALEAEALKVAAGVKTPKPETTAVPSEKKKVQKSERRVTFQIGSAAEDAGNGGGRKLKEGVAPPSTQKPQTRRRSGSFVALVPPPRADKAKGARAEAEEDEDGDDEEEGAEEEEGEDM